MSQIAREEWRRDFGLPICDMENIKMASASYSTGRLRLEGLCRW